MPNTTVACRGAPRTNKDAARCVTLDVSEYAEAVSTGGGCSSSALPPPLGAARTTIFPRLPTTDRRTLSPAGEEQARYEPVRLLGSGGMGEVILVQDHDIARRVAVKRPNADISNPTVFARFVDEIRTVGRLEHPKIVPIHDVGIDELGRYYSVMKYVAGETLESVIVRLRAGDASYHATYSFERRIQIFVGLLNALAYSHDQGIVHRDIKPANVMIGSFGEVVLMDWGVAKPMTSDGRAPTAVQIERGDPRARTYATHNGALIGTPAYMSPEQARGENDTLDARSDRIWAEVFVAADADLGSPAGAEGLQAEQLSPEPGGARRAQVAR